MTSQAAPPGISDSSVALARTEAVARVRVAFFDNNGVLPEKRGQGWGTFMYRQGLQHFREQGIRFVFVEADLDEPHIPARRAYEAVGFDSQQRIVIYRQNLDRHNPGSELEDVAVEQHK